jgi:subtilisin-like proprotein convertase family protein
LGLPFRGNACAKLAVQDLGSPPRKTPPKVIFVCITISYTYLWLSTGQSKCSSCAYNAPYSVWLKGAAFQAFSTTADQLAWQKQSLSASQPTTQSTPDRICHNPFPSLYDNQYCENPTTLSPNLKNPRMKRLLLACLGLLFFPLAHAQTYMGLGGPIDNSGQISTFSQSVSGLSPSTLDATHGLLSVCVDIAHTWDSDLVLRLRAPDGTTILLSNQNGGSGQNYANTCFADSAVASIAGGSPPFTGTFAPQGLLGTANNSQDGNGIWQLEIEDVFPFGDSGLVISWALTFGANPPAPFSFDSSFLPIIVINTNGQGIADDPKIIADMGIIYNGPSLPNHLSDPYNDYNGKIGIELRGRSSQGFDKKSYGFETWDGLAVDIDASLLGMPAESDWVLHGPYPDKSLMRNALMMELARQAGQYASRTKHVELMLNGSYEGVYVLMEKIKRDTGRVHIAKLDTSDVAGDDLTGGYIFQINKDASTGWYSNYDAQTSPGSKMQFSHVYPKHADIRPVQASYLAAYVDSFEAALKSPLWSYPAGVRYDHYIDMHSFAVQHLLFELAKNVDAYRLSTYFFKDKDSKGGKLTAGPMWDFDLAMRNANYCNAEYVSGWMYDEHCDNENPFWYQRLRQDSAFANELRCTWQALRTTTFSDANIFAVIDSMETLLTDPADRNFQRWQVLGTYLWPNPSPIPTTYTGEVTTLRTWFQARGAWIDSQLAGTCLVGLQDASAGMQTVLLSPNPSKGMFRLQVQGFQLAEMHYQIQNMLGQVLRSGTMPDGNAALEFDLSALPAGIYHVSVRQGETLRVQKLVLE